MLLWFAVRDFAIETGDGDLLTEATRHISEIAFELTSRPARPRPGSTSSIGAASPNPPPIPKRC